MSKAQLINLLQSAKTSQEIVQEGWFQKIPVDSEIALALMVKLQIEAQEVVQQLNQNQITGQQDPRPLLSQLDFIRKVVFNTCLSEVRNQPYMAQSIQQVKQFVSDKLLQKVQSKLEEGWEVNQDPLTGNFTVVDKFNQAVHSYPYQSSVEMLGEIGVDTSHKAFGLFYAALFPREDLKLFRQTYIFTKVFQLQ